MVLIMAVFAPQLKTINDSWASKQANAELLQNARVLVDQINRSISSADKIIDVSDSTETNGYIEFKDNTGTTYRMDIAANNYIEFGPVGSLSDLAGPVSQLKITCYSKDDFTTPTTVANDIRFIKTEVIFPNPGPGQDRTFMTSTYLRTNASSKVGMWKLDDASGLTAVDSSGNDNHGTLTNMAGDEWTDGVIDGGLEFDGSNDYILVPVSGDYATSLTFTAWFKSDDAGSIGNNYLAQRFVSQPRSNLYSRIAFGINSNKIGTYWHDGWHNVGQGTTILSPGVWYHGALTYDGSTIRIYLDGIEENSFSESNLIVPSSSFYMQIGRQISGERYFDGVLDDVYIYDHVLNAEEIAELVDILRYLEFAESKAGSNTTSITIPTPTTDENDLLIAAVATDENTSATLSPPGGQGWTEININSYLNQVTLGAWWKLADASEAPTHQFTWSGGQQAYGWMMRFTGHDTSSPINAFLTNSGTNILPTSPSVTTTVANCMILRIGGFNDDDVSVDNPGLSGHTAITMDESNSGLDTCSGGAGYTKQSGSNDSGTSTFSLIAPEKYRTITIAIAPDPDAGVGSDELLP